MKIRKKIAGFLAAAVAVTGLSLTAFAESEPEEVYDFEAEAAEGVALDAAHFPDEVFRDYISDTYDTDKDGVLSKDEIKGITNLFIIDCSGMKSLKGVEYFTSLEWLDIYEADEVDSIDVSKNTTLELIQVSGNISSLILGEKPLLADLDCRENKLTSLDLSGCTALTSLYCEKNQLVSLDVSGCTALITLRCNDNQLTSLNVSSCTVLSSIDCQANQLTSLDVSKNKALTYLRCYDNQLTSLDVSENTKLGVLYCEKNKFTSLDLSKNTELDDKYIMTDKTITIYGTAGSSAETYAKRENIKFVAGSAPAPAPAPSRPTTVKSAANMLGATVMCSKVDGAKTYRLFYTTDNGKNYKKVGDSKTRKWEVTGLKAGVEYKFLVLASNGEKWSTYKKGDCYAAVTPSPTVKATAGKAKAVVTCSTVAGAKKYRLFYTTDNGKSYKKVGDNTTRKWTVTGLKSGAEYKFLVLAYDGKKWSAYKKGDCYAAVTIK